MKRLIYILFFILLLSQAFTVQAVTDKEMEHARVIATQTYLRYANDGSDYLDKLNPTTMAELESKLKAKEKENIKAFKAIPVPKDYASWDKQKLVDYWSNTAFASAGLTAKGKIGKARARKKLSNLTVSAPATKKEASPAETKQPEAKPQAQGTPSKETSAPQQSNPAVTEDANPDANLDSAKAALEEAQTLAEASMDADDAQIKKVENNTWIYVVILCILVAVVVALVVFASNVMKKNAPNPENRQLREGASSDTKALNNKLKETAAQLDEAMRQNAALKKKIETLTAELNDIRQHQAETQIPKPRQIHAEAESQPVSSAPVYSTATVHPQRPAPVQNPKPAPAPKVSTTGKPGLRTIYLGRANAKGIFIRADRTLNPGNSFFRLDTTDGFAGSFRVVNDPSVIEKVQSNPMEVLANACLGPDLADTAGLEKIVTDSAGTAIFEGGCWKVSRKAKVHYE